MIKPNIFRWATSELTQDAFICWLIEWAKPKYKNELLNKIALKFLSQIAELGTIDILSIEIRKQYRNVDVLVVINGSIGILIEDKVHSKNHSDQLSRYSESLKAEFQDNDLHLVYLKTGDQSNYSVVESKGYKTFQRYQFIELLQEGKKIGVTNEIFISFLQHLQCIDDSVQSFRILPVDQWHWDSWRGFYMELQKRLGEGEWDYIPQKNGGFLGFWWNWNYMNYNNTGFDYYLQLEHGKFCFKITPDNTRYNYEAREYFRRILFAKANQSGLKLRRNGRCVIGKTKTMTVAKLDTNYIIMDSSGIINLDSTVEKIKQIQTVFNSLTNSSLNGVDSPT